MSQFLIRNRFILLNRLQRINLSLNNSLKHRRPQLSHPALWYEDYPISLIGCRQSPINIERQQCIENIILPELRIEHPPSISGLRLRNPMDQSYFGWRVDIPYDFGDKTIISGGPLSHRYKLIQFHAHWGENCDCGSEHILDGRSFSAELHFVYWNIDLYQSPRQASISKDGLVVVGVFMKVSSEKNSIAAETIKSESIKVICDLLPTIKYKGSFTLIERPLNIFDLFPSNRSYFTYLGSLTTPPLYETVTWIIFEDPISIDEEQLRMFRTVSYYQKNNFDADFPYEIYDTNVENNIRSVQPLNGRKIIYVANDSEKNFRKI
ncbi:hypothetical protein NH340_JMT06429 [Sarcoptes scabiei]|nr:hypothetical protein NH340_JMT06429 [Sarcoptes scabiei]